MSPILAVGAIINAVVLLQCGMGLLSALLPLRMQEAGFSSSQIGIMSAGFSGGFLLGCIMAPSLIRRIGHIRAFSALATVLSALTLALAIDTDLFLWTGARLLSGICYAGLLTTSDSWISGETDRSVRGRVMSAYMICYKVAQASGPLLLTVATISGNWHFMLVSALFSLSLLPVAVRHGGNPTPPSDDRMGIVKVYQKTPLAIVGCLCISTSNSGLGNLIGLYGLAEGLEVHGAVVLSSVLQFGALFLQWPMGWSSDRIDRRLVMVIGIGAMALASAILVALPALPLWGYSIFVALIGGLGFSIYPIIVAHAGDFVEQKQMVPLCATLMLSFAFGMTLGPLTASTAMEWLGPDGLLYHTILFNSIFVGFAIYRMTQRSSPQPTGAYVNVPASSVAISQLNPRSAGPEIDESLEAVFGPNEEAEVEEVPHYKPSGK